MVIETSSNGGDYDGETALAAKARGEDEGERTTAVCPRSRFGDHLWSA